jgi:hypothetical protein
MLVPGIKGLVRVWVRSGDGRIAGAEVPRHGPGFGSARRPESSIFTNTLSTAIAVSRLLYTTIKSLEI